MNWNVAAGLLQSGRQWVDHALDSVEQMVVYALDHPMEVAESLPAAGVIVQAVNAVDREAYSLHPSLENLAPATDSESRAMASQVALLPFEFVGLGRVVTGARKLLTRAALRSEQAAMASERLALRASRSAQEGQRTHRFGLPQWNAVATHAGLLELPGLSPTEPRARAVPATSVVEAAKLEAAK